MAHPLVDQLRFTRAEWRRALQGIPESDGGVRIQPMNSIGWIVAHLAWQEQHYWLRRAQGRTPFPELQEIAPNGGPPTTPALRDMLRLWRQVTTSVDPWLDDLTTATLAADLGGPGGKRTVADSVQRVT
jgi:DinB superfamily